jgi:hypothetical protein
MVNAPLSRILTGTIVHGVALDPLVNEDGHAIRTYHDSIIMACRFAPHVTDGDIVLVGRHEPGGIVPWGVGTIVPP